MTSSKAAALVLALNGRLVRLAGDRLGAQTSVDSTASSTSWSSPTATRSPVADLDGEILIEHTRPAPGVTCVGKGRPRGPKNPEVSPMS
jgi:hypothetical protein